MTKNIKDCAHCPGGLGLEYSLFNNDLFWIVCDCHPLIRGHILIIPKEHLSCMGKLSESAFSIYKELYDKVKEFVNRYYGPVAVFEHGIVGQTVFHAHTHFLPFDGKIDKIVPQTNALTKIESLDQVIEEFKKSGKYLFVEVKNETWLVDTSIGYPKFFREIFAKTLMVEERADWKATRNNPKLMAEFKEDVKDLMAKWKEFE